MENQNIRHNKTGYKDMEIKYKKPKDKTRPWQEHDTRNKNQQSWQNWDMMFIKGPPEFLRCPVIWEVMMLSFALSKSCNILTFPD